MSNKIARVLVAAAAAGCLGCAPVYLSRPGGRGVVLVRVALRHNAPEVRLAGDGARIADAGHGATLAPGESWTVTAAGGGLRAVTGRGTEIGAISGPLRAWAAGGVEVEGRRVAAAVELRPEAGGGVLVIAELPLEQYVAGVVAAELGMAKPDEIEAAKAQAVASRSYACATLGSRPGAGYDLEATVAHQAFDPGKPVGATAARAARETEGLVLTRGGSVFAANYHSTCGGRTALASEAWNADDRKFPHIASVRDGHCGVSPRFSWADTIAATDISLRLFGANAEIRDVDVAQRGPSGRAVALRISSAAADTTLHKDKIRFGLASRPLPSTLFDLQCLRDESGNVGAVALKGFGYGHGVGMCQWGAIGMARAGKSYVRILKHYYRDVRIETLR